MNPHCDEIGDFLLVEVLQNLAIYNNRSLFKFSVTGILLQEKLNANSLMAILH